MRKQSDRDVEEAEMFSVLIEIAVAALLSYKVFSSRFPGVSMFFF